MNDNPFLDILFWPFIVLAGAVGWYLLFGDIAAASTFWSW